MLFLPPQAPVALPAEGTVLIGRHKDADLRLSDVDTSRRHAEILCHDGRCVLRDLGSTNGTWVNDERVEQRELRGGERIEIGGNLITFCQIDGLEQTPENADDSALTVFVERSTGPESFGGDLAEIPPFAVVQILEMGRKTGVLVMETEQGDGRLWFEQGDPTHAETKEQLGFDAALALVNASQGRFRFEAQAEMPEPTIQATVTQLLLEASRLLDEGPALD